MHSELPVLRFCSHFRMPKRRTLVWDCCPTLPYDWRRLLSPWSWECLWVVISPPHISLLSWLLTVDLSVDGIFILFPIITLWKVKLPQNLRRIIIFAFSGSALTLVTAVLFCVIGYNSNLNLGPDPDTIIRLASHLEVCLSLLFKVYIHTYINFQISGSFFLDGRQSFGYGVIILSYLQTDPRPWRPRWTSNLQKITFYNCGKRRDQWFGKGNIHRSSVCVGHRRQVAVIYTDTAFASCLVVNSDFRTYFPPQWKYVCLMMLLPRNMRGILLFEAFGNFCREAWYSLLLGWTKTICPQVSGKETSASSAHAVAFHAFQKSILMV